ncbi:TM2 domain-containing protein [Mucilaginibacter conchicola]|uniref:TM2 domain-containing protein n=1 Tax=Mucilaginibacter conchicola TaxID=2303333 RepID=A0A372NUJ3_9SPHI|nr:TM2 domain-containing protein [Mucilaginibacter conchicola]RFZ92581.1 TM2 domain-containing protein [Mucilaginibacter conchicola]
MNTYNPYISLPGISPEEIAMLSQTTAGLSDAQKQSFYQIYVGKRKNPQEIMLFILFGFLGVAGLHKFLTGQTTLGVVYLFTAGLFFVGTVMDLINHQDITNQYNQKMAFDSLTITKTVI